MKVECSRLLPTHPLLVGLARPLFLEVGHLASWSSSKPGGVVDKAKECISGTLAVVRLWDYLRESSTALLSAQHDT